MVISSAFLPQKQYVFYTEKQVFWLWHALSNLGGKKKIIRAWKSQSKLNKSKEFSTS